MLVVAFTVVSVFFVTLSLFFYQHRRKKFNRFKELNIPGPEPHWFYGNVREYYALGPEKAHLEWSRKYGKNFGYYFGERPVLVIGDVDLLRQIQIKDFKNFINRPPSIPGGINPGKEFNLHMIVARDQNWKNQRAVLTPSFTTGKMKQMVPILQGALDEFMAKVEQKAQSGREFEIFGMFKALTADVIGRTAFGVQTNVQKDSQDPFFQGLQDVFKDDVISGLKLLAVCLPGLIWLLHPFRWLYRLWTDMSGATNLQVLADRCRAIVKIRRENPQNRRNDLLQLMVDAEMSHKEIAELSSEDLTIDDQTDTTNQKTSNLERSKGQKKSFQMSDDQVISNTFLMLLAGYETTSTALAFTSHILVNYPEIQEKVRKEVQEACQKDGFLDYTSVFQCKYLDQVLMESLRFYPPVQGFVSRLTEEDVSYGPLFIPKGFTVQVSLALHRDPDYWANPDSIDPDRFSAENRGSIHPLAFQSFGGGPRNCIGMRFAQMEAKLALANLLLKYRLVPGVHTERIDPELVY